MMILPWIFLGLAAAGVGVLIHDYRKEQREYM